jgi:dihydroneopterin aldolase
MIDSVPVHNAKIADAQGSVRHVFVRDLELKTLVGVHEHEKIAPQRVIINVDLMVSEENPVDDTVFSTVVDYERVVRRIQTLLTAGGHVNLLETLAERIAASCMEDGRVMGARIRIEKPDVMAEVASVGIEIERMR